MHKNFEPAYVTEDSLSTIRSIAKYDIDKARSRKMISEIIKIPGAIFNRTYAIIQGKPLENDS